MGKQINTIETSREFDWLDEENVIVRHQPAIAIYTNRAGDVVLRQQGDVYDDDPFIWFTVEHAEAVARAILQEAGLDAAALAPEPHVNGKPKDSTAAERQRRYRERQKKESTPDIFDRDTVTRDGVTPRNGHLDAQP